MITVSLKSSCSISNIALLLPAGDASGHYSRLQRQLHLFAIGGRVSTRHLGVAALVAAVSPPEVRVVATAIGGPCGVGPSSVGGLLALPFVGSKAAEPEEPLPELGGHEVVQDWIDG